MRRYRLSVPFPEPFEVRGLGRWPTHVIGYAWRSSHRHQIGIAFVALAVAALSIVPVELQRRMIDGALEDGDLDLLLWLGGIFLAVILATEAGKFLLGTYQNWIGQSVLLRQRDHLAHRHDAEEGDGKAVAVINAESEQIGVFVGAGLSDLVADGFKFVFAVGYIAYSTLAMGSGGRVAHEAHLGGALGGLLLGLLLPHAG